MREAPRDREPEPPPVSTFPDTPARRAALELRKQGVPGLFDPDETA